ncbi:MAG: hypothetical protein K9H61_07230 [Bacteroidia bacterium]|nr:hypothetical protein [Bacteroidia bacterium]MCF8446772.1 hypothetical protein [Bacteroidia bacterium]
MEKPSAEIIGIDLAGRVNSLDLAERNMLLPLMEAIVNSIHAIEDAKIVDGQITITIKRDNNLNLGEEDDSLPYINGFTITDNGLGFDEINYSSFKRAFSTHKALRGGKGLGRFLWLKAFSNARIESIFIEEDNAFKRTFKFTLAKENGIEQSDCIPSDKKIKRFTKVDLIGFKEPYKSKCPKKPETIANRIIEHCLIYFLNNKDIKFTLKDDSHTINLNKKFENLTSGKIFKDKFTVNEHNFTLRILKWFEHDEFTNHKLSYCSNHREVESFPISKVFPDIQGKIYDEEMGKYFLIVGYIESEYLDKNTNDERTEIKFSKKKLFDDLLIDENLILAKLEPILRLQFESVVSKYKEKKYKRINNYVAEDAPQYLILNKYPELLDSIVVTENTTDQELDLKLYKLYQDIDFESRKNVNELLYDQYLTVDGIDAIREKYLNVINTLSEINKSKLAQYVVHRKYIIELFEQSLALNEKGKYELEKTVHDIIFPTKKNSGEISFEDQNLWLLDERLSFHTFLSSDKPLNTIEGLETDSIDRPDLLIFNNPISFVEGEGSSFNSIVLVEFKRPMRGQYDPENDNPITQLYNYVRKIRDGKQMLLNGRKYPTNDNTWFYIYLVCDVNYKIDQFAEDANLDKTQDGLGYYGFNKNIKCMIEIMTFDQVKDNAKKRNKILFHKLGI